MGLAPVLDILGPPNVESAVRKSKSKFSVAADSQERL